ncbi:MAG: type II secretion system F family protein, partial [Cellvibrionaceae bacterium]|nr:type II secretion system F family protein [Cellvibrionaceae bacterium]
MAEYSYKAAGRDGKLSSGNITAASKELAIRELRKQGLTPVSVNAGAVVTAVPASLKLKRDQVINITQELTVLLRAGLPLDRALKVLIEMSQEAAPKAVLEDFLSTVKGGKGLSQALAPYEEDFGSFYISMIRSGEASGSLAEVLERLTEYLDNAKALRAGVVSALIYPMVLMVVAALSLVVMLGFVVPQFQALFNDMGDKLPALTAAVIAMGDFVKTWWWALGLLVGALVWYVKRWLRTPVGRDKWHGFLLSAPVLGETVFKYEMAKFSRTVGTLLGNGVSLLQALNIAIGTVDNVHMKGALESLPPAVKQGKRISATMEAEGVFTPKVVQIVRVGEESGSLDEMMLEL